MCSSVFPGGRAGCKPPRGCEAGCRSSFSGDPRDPAAGSLLHSPPGGQPPAPRTRLALPGRGSGRARPGHPRPPLLHRQRLVWALPPPRHTRAPLARVSSPPPRASLQRRPADREPQASGAGVGAISRGCCDRLRGKGRSRSSPPRLPAGRRRSSQRPRGCPLSAAFRAWAGGERGRSSHTAPRAAGGSPLPTQERESRVCV